MYNRKDINDSQPSNFASPIGSEDPAIYPLELFLLHIRPSPLPLCTIKQIFLVLPSQLKHILSRFWRHTSRQIIYTRTARTDHASPPTHPPPRSPPHHYPPPQLHPNFKNLSSVPHPRPHTLYSPLLSFPSSRRSHHHMQTDSQQQTKHLCGYHWPV